MDFVRYFSVMDLRNQSGATFRRTGGVGHLVIDVIQWMSLETMDEPSCRAFLTNSSMSAPSRDYCKGIHSFSTIARASIRSTTATRINEMVNQNPEQLE
jgi:hypothetical protein